MRPGNGPYDAGFEQHLLDYNILPLGYDPLDGNEPEPPDNMSEIQPALAAPRTSEPAEDFKSFQRAYRRASNEEDALNLIDTFQGDKVALLQSHAIRQKEMMNQLAALTDGSIVSGNPDRIDGAQAAELALCARRQLKDLVVPTAEQNFICPNFVVHVKGDDGSAEVARVQAVYGGALAVRGMQALWDFGDGPDVSSVDRTRRAGRDSGSPGIRETRSQSLTEPSSDLLGYSGISWVARTITCTWVDGILKMYTIYCEVHQDIREEPLAGNPAAKAPRYASTLVGSWITTDREADFREGLAAYRNGLDWAKRQRDMAISRANARVRVEDARRRRDEEEDNTNEGKQSEGKDD